MKEIIDAITGYARAYETLERFQQPSCDAMPRGDQKTGVIAEFFARLYARVMHPNATVEYGSTSQHAWDIRVSQPGLHEKLIQVKSVSCFSKTSRVSPIHPGWDELYLIRLDKRFLPVAFRVIRKSDVAWAEKSLKHKTMPHPEKAMSGSPELREGVECLDKLFDALGTADPTGELGGILVMSNGC